jgi:hypothetical protein
MINYTRRLQELPNDFLEKAKNGIGSWYDLVAFYRVSEDILIEFKDKIPFYYLVQFQEINKYSKKIQLFILCEILKEDYHLYNSFKDKYFTKYMQEKFEILNMLT